MWIPELGCGNAIYMEPVEGVESVPKSRWKLVSRYEKHKCQMYSRSKAHEGQICSLCRERVGACIQCDNRSCFTAFHVTCARQMGYLTNMKSMAQDGPLRAFCDKHLPVSHTTYPNDGNTEILRDGHWIADLQRMSSAVMMSSTFRMQIQITWNRPLTGLLAPGSERAKPRTSSTTEIVTRMVVDD